MHFGDQQIRSELCDLGADHRGVLCGIALGTNCPMKGQSVPHESISEVELFAPGLGQRCIALMPDDADHFDPFRLRSANADEDALPEGRLVGKGLRCEKLVDDHYVPVGGVVRLGERASCDEPHAKRFEVTREYKLTISRLILARIRERFASAPAGRSAWPRERERPGSGHAFDTRQRAQPALQLAHESGALLRLFLSAIAEQLECK